MAFPVVESVTPSVFSIAATSHLVAMPAVVLVGELLVTEFVNPGDATVTTPAGWTQLHATANGTTARLGSYYRIAGALDGGATFDFVTSASKRAVAHVYRVSGWHGTTPPEVGTAATGSSTTPDPPTLTPSWGAADTLWLAVAGSAGAVTVTTYPTSYTDGVDDNTTGANSVMVGSARRQLNGTSDDPGTFTVSATGNWVAQTVAIRPGGGGTAHTATVTDPESLTDSLSSVVDSVRTPSDGLGLTDSTVRAASYDRPVTDSLGLSDSISASLGFSVTITDGLGLSDSVSPSSAYDRTVVDGLGLTDSTVRAASYGRTQSDSFGLSDNVSLSVAYAQTVTDGLALVDSLAAELAASFFWRRNPVAFTRVPVVFTRVRGEDVPPW